jgi:predicted permease
MLALLPRTLGEVQNLTMFVETLFLDILFACRQLWKNRGFSVAAVLSLALAMGLNTAVFSLAEAISLRKLPVSHPEQLEILHWTSRGTMPWTNYASHRSCEEHVSASEISGCSFTYAIYEWFQGRLNGLSGLAAYGPPTPLRLVINGTPTQVPTFVTPVSGNFDELLGMTSVCGRGLTPNDDRVGAERVAVLGYSFWEAQFGGSRSIIGTSIGIGTGSATIVGVAPKQFMGVEPTARTDVWVPIRTWLHLQPGSSSPPNDMAWLYLIARKRPGIESRVAESELSVAFAQIMTRDPSSKISPQEAPGISLTDGSSGLTSLRQKFSAYLRVLAVIVAGVLLVACANLATLLLARGAARGGEIATRLALGAQRTRLVRQLLTENLVIAILGGAVGIFLAFWTSRSLAAFVTADLATNTILDTHLDLGIFLYMAILILCVVAFGLIPALRLTNADPARALIYGGGVRAAFSHQAGRSSPGKWLVAAEVAVSLVLLIGAGLFVRTLLNLEGQESGLHPEQLFTFGLTGRQGDVPSRIQSQAFADIHRRIEQLPGVHSSAWSWSIPLGYYYTTVQGVFDGRPELDSQRVIFLPVGPGFFETMDISLLEGRTMRYEDTRPGVDFVWINKSLARLYFGMEDPIGKPLRISVHMGVPDPAGKTLSPPLIMGVVEDTKIEHLRADVLPTIYHPADQGFYQVVRSDLNPRRLEGEIREIVGSVAPSIGIVQPQTLERIIEHDLTQERLMARLSAALSALTAALACIGVYGVLAYSVSRRTGEIAVRMSLGAMRSDILLLALREGLGPALLGIAAGLIGSYAATKLAAALLYGVKPLDPAIYALASLLLLLVAAAACYFPARRATTVDPNVALRYE